MSDSQLWSKSEEEFVAEKLIDEPGTMSVKEVARLLGRTPAAIQVRVTKLKRIKNGCRSTVPDPWEHKSIRKVSRGWYAFSMNHYEVQQ